MHGSPVCHAHGGRAPQVRKAAAERVQTMALRQTADRLGVPVEVDPAQGIIDLIEEAAGNVEFYRQLVAALPTHPEPDELITTGTDSKGNTVERWKHGAPGIYGRTYHISGIETGEAKKNILVVMYDEERDRLARYIKDALTLNLDERRVRLAETTARDLFAALGEAMTAAELSPEQAVIFRDILAERLKNRPALSPS